MRKRNYQNLTFITDKKFKKLKVSEKDRKDYYKLKRVIKEIPKLELDIEYLKDEIKDIQQKKEKYSRIVTELYNRVNYIFDDYQPNIYVVTNIKKSKSGELQKFWMVNVKYKNKTKPIYLGSDSKVRKTISKIHKKRINMKEEKLRELLRYELVDNIWDWVIEERENIFNLKVNMESFLDS